MYKNLFFLLCFISIGSFAQNQEQEGYIITNATDTLRGYIEDQRLRHNLNEIWFIDEAHRQKTRYTPGEIKGYFSNGNYYETTVLKLKDQPVLTVFAKPIVKGRLAFIVMVPASSI